MAKKPIDRGIVFDTEALKYSRKVKNKLTQQQLANKAGFKDVVTVYRAEKGEKIDIAYAEAIAVALNEKLTDLAPRAKGVANSAMAIAEMLAQLFLRIVQDRSVPEPQKPHALQLVTDLAIYLHFEKPINPENVGSADGSLIVTVPLSRPDTAKLMNAFVAGELDQFDIVSITVSRNPIALTRKPSRGMRSIAEINQAIQEYGKELESNESIENAAAENQTQKDLPSDTL